MEMEEVAFTDNETKYFGDIFINLNTEGSGKIPIYNVQEFLRASKLSQEALIQICHMSGSSVQGWYGRKELFIALKLVAAAQRGLPVNLESLFIAVDLPLPRLHFNHSSSYDKSVAYKDHSTSSPDLIQLSDSDCNSSQMIDGGYRMMESEEGELGDEGLSEPSALNVSLSHSPSVSSAASDSPTPTNSLQDRSYSKPVHSHWRHGLMTDEHRQLLATEDDSLASDEDHEDVWTVTEEQQNYYTNQFLLMQHDAESSLSWSVAREFFEKSKLPPADLSKIWKLTDVSRDGGLFLLEFCIAMHLVVLRRNHIELPDTIPPALVQSLQASFVGQETCTENSISGNSVTSVSPLTTVDASLVTESVGVEAAAEILSPSKSKEWTKFVDSPTSTVSSPGLKPVNFDFQKLAVEKDPKILHPKPMRLTPEGKRIEVEREVSLSPDTTFGSTDISMEILHSRTMCNQSPKRSHECADDQGQQRSIRPLPTKPNVCAGNFVISNDDRSTETPSPEDNSYGPTSLPVFPPVGPLAPRKDPPPPPPPRTGRSHTRSSSLDLNQFKLQGKQVPVPLNEPPALPPRVPSPTSNSPSRRVNKTDGDHLQSLTRNDISDTEENTRISAFEIYKKPELTVASLATNIEEIDPSAQLAVTNKVKDKRDVQTCVQTMKEKNTILKRLNSELNQELAEAMEERIALELQLEQMKFFFS